MTDRGIDDVFRESAPQSLDEIAARRLVSMALGRMSRRRRRRRAAWVAGCAAAMALVALALPPRRPPRPEPVPPQVAVVAVAPTRGVPPPAPRPAKEVTRRRPTAPAPVRVSLEALEGRIAASRSPDAAARLFWEACARAEAEPLAPFLKRVLPRISPAAGRAIAAEARRSSNAADVLAELAAELAASGAKEAWPLLQAIIDAQGPDPSLIAAAGKLGDPRAVPVLRRWLCLADRRAVAAAAALGRIPGPEALRALLSAHEALQGAAVLLVPALGEELSSALERRSDELEQLLVTAPRAERSAVVRALGDLRTPGAMAALVRALEEPELRPLARRYLDAAVPKTNFQKTIVQKTIVQKSWSPRRELRGEDDTPRKENT